ncbi:NADH-cytochrome b5 reductase [Friedmanniomyces endolithicus]|nr:NADH-cytochrome b5 reductase [Friedmanniomyces endolithicus]KAK0832195.1 NADH-cytochrome b5 reductase [Friedmanniomyces endolithicus]
MAFSFGFEDDEADDAKTSPAGPSVLKAGKVQAHQAPVKEHTLEELIAKLPDHLSYSTVRIESPTGRVLFLPKRDLYDVRVQLLQEGPTNDDVIDQIGTSDLRSGVYEGGFKTWECSLDLASLLLDRGPRKDIDELIRCDQIIELGAGTALPSLVLFQHALLNSIPLTFTLADFNDTVLRLVTLPNLILTWAATTKQPGFTTPKLDKNSTGDFDLTPEVIQHFLTDLKSNDIILRFLSGPWSPSLANLIPSSGVDMGTVILAAETIYSPESTEAFTELICGLLKRVKMSKAMIAAKRMYFGVGGSVDGLKAACRERGAVAYEIENHGVPGMEGGHVRRYATEPPKSGSNNTILYGLLGAGALGGGYYYLNSSNSTTAQHGAKNESGALGMPASKNEEKNIPAKAVAGTGVAPVKAFTGGDQGFISLLLESVENVSHNTKKFRFKLNDEDSTSGLPVASALLTKFKGPDMEKPVIRPYTPVSDEDEKGYLDFVVKVYPNGPMSEHLHAMKAGERLDFKGPIPKYPWTANKHDHIALIAGGTGITPMYQVARAIFKNPEDKTKVTLVFGNVSEEDILLKKEWEDLEREFPQRFRAFYVLDNPPEGWTQGKGFITKDLLKTTLPGPKDGNIKLFVCGPPGLYKAIAGPKKSPGEQGELSGILSELGYTQEQVYKF